MSATVAPDSILKELAALWTQQGKEGDAGVLRACSMTLLVIAEAADDASALGETLAALMPEHPARTILIRLQGDGERALSERVYQQCWKPFGQRQQICCEQIEITASDAALADLPSVILPLAVPDLPLILWCRGARLVRRPEFGEIARMATKVVIDSAAAGVTNSAAAGVTNMDATGAIRRMADGVRSGGILADLAWTRLTRWRETLARVFENRDTLARLSEVNSVQVRFGPVYETAAWYLAAWVANALAAVGQVVTPVLVRQDESLRLELSGGQFKVELSRQDERLVTVVNEQSNCTSLSRPTDYLLMREELGIVRRDAVFELTLASAARLAVSSSSGQS
jgi:glucose-6-phosphate dehydrogenase assembly protein OpcA